MFSASFARTFFLAAGFAIAFFHFFYMFFVASGCKVAPYSADRYMAYCRKPGFASYEHGAVYYGLEPKVLENLKNADVVFVGDSELQMGFSEDNVEQFFRERGIRYYVLGFGYGDSSDLIYAIFKKYGLKPKVVITDSDPFFRRYKSVPTEEVLEGGLLSRLRNIGKKYSQEYYRKICSRIECAQTYPTIYRSLATGTWYWQHTLADPNITKPFDYSPPPDPKVIAEGIQVGEEFLSDLGLDRPCFILTGVPTPEYDMLAVAEALGKKLGTAVVNVRVKNLATIDRGHLNADSARRWSTAFLAEAEGLLNSCLKSAPAKR